MSFTIELAISPCRLGGRLLRLLKWQFTTDVAIYNRSTRENCSHIHSNETKSTTYSSGITFALNKVPEMILEGDLN